MKINEKLLKINEKTAAATGAEGSARPPAPGGQRGHPRRGVKASKTEQHYKTHFVTAVRDDNAQEHSLSLAEYPEAIRFRKKEKKN